MLLLHPLSVLVITLFHNVTVPSAKPQNGKLTFSGSYHPGLPEEGIMMSKRGVGHFPVRWYTGMPGRAWFRSRLHKPQPQAQAVVPDWCQGNRVVSKTIARARKHICPEEPSKLVEPRKYRDIVGMSYGRG